MKKISVILLAVTILFSITGCGREYSNEASFDNQGTGEPSGVPEKGAKLVIWEDSAERIQYMEYVAEKFMEEYGVEVEVEQVVDFTNRMVQDAPSYLGPDLLEAPHDNLGNLIAAGLIQPTGKTIEEIQSNYIETAGKCLIYEGQVYGYPISISTYALIYNKNIVSTPPEDFQEIIDFAQTFNNPKENKYALMWQVSSTYYSHCFLAGYGAYVFGDNGSNKDDLGLNTNEAIEGAKFYRSLKDILDIESADAEGQIIDGLFTSGKLAYTINGLWSVTAYENAGIEVGVAPLPKMPNGKYPTSYLGVQAIYVSAYSKYPNAAKLFAEMASSEEMLLKRYEITHEIPAMKSLSENETIISDSVTSAFMQQARYSTPMPFIPQMGVVWDPYMRALQSIWDNDTDPKTAMDECVKIIKSSISAQK